MSSGSLVVVGTGIKLVGHVTLEAQAFIKNAQKVLFLVNEPATAHWIQQLNPNAESIHRFYDEGKLRLHTYQEMVEYILANVREGLQVCAVFYGHPGIFVTPSREMIRQARRESFHAWMAPGISAEDCLYADLGVDPSQYGCQSYEATEFLLRGRKADPTTALILWQIGVIGELHQKQERDVSTGLRLITAVLLDAYGPEHEVTVYEAALYPTFEPSIQRVRLDQLPDARLTTLSTLYVPPKTIPAWDKELMARLGIDFADILWEQAA